MSSPITIGTTAIVAVPINTKRSEIRFQNTGTTTIYLKKIPLSDPTPVVSATDYEIKLLPLSGEAEGGEAFTTNSIASFAAIGSAASGTLSVFETSFAR